MARVFLPPPADTSRLAYVRHFVGYDAGYYGYHKRGAVLVSGIRPESLDI